LIAEKSKGQHAHLASIPDGVHRRNRRPDGQSKSDERRRTKPVDPRLGHQGEPSFRDRLYNIAAQNLHGRTASLEIAIRDCAPSRARASIRDDALSANSDGQAYSCNIAARTGKTLDISLRDRIALQIYPDDRDAGLGVTSGGSAAGAAAKMTFTLNRTRSAAACVKESGWIRYSMT
jgi:hypothetical protein